MREELLKKLRGLIGDPRVRELVERRMDEFRRKRYGTEEELFEELCFCILTAGFNAERSMAIQKEVGRGFVELNEGELANKLRELGHRYPRSRARYIVEARKYLGTLKSIASSTRDELALREWLVKHMKGLGYKEASHFLRNLGFTNVAILDFHVLNLLDKYGVVEKPRTLTKRKYLEIESLLRRIAEELGVTLGELDLYLWYLETGKILK